MDDTTKPVVFRVRKAVRYARLYGPRRTVAKVRSQHHMGRKFETLPNLVDREDLRRHVGLIGCGKFAYAQIAYYLSNRVGPVIRGAMDVEIDRAASLAERYDLEYYTDDANRVFGDPRIDLVYVAANHASQAEYAIEALARGKHVHVEKPHVVSLDQLERLTAAMTSSRGRVTLGFNRPHSRIGLEIKRALDEQRGPAMLNWFVVGHPIGPDHWYFLPGEGGTVLGNLCHWTDFVYRLVPSESRYPIEIRPTRVVSPERDLAVTYVFGDGTIAAITFSAAGAAFEGVRERFSAQRGDAVIVMDDFERLRIDVGHRRSEQRMRRRDHGHEATILRSYAMTGRRGPAEPGATVGYVWETGELVLRTREALDTDRAVVVEPYLAPAANLR
jgi:predicted dehydrogenase